MEIIIQMLIFMFVSHSFTEQSIPELSGVSLLMPGLLSPFKFRNHILADCFDKQYRQHSGDQS